MTVDGKEIPDGWVCTFEYDGNTWEMVGAHVIANKTWDEILEDVIEKLNAHDPLGGLGPATIPLPSTPAPAPVPTSAPYVVPTSAGATMKKDPSISEVSRLSKGRDSQVFCCAGKRLVQDPNYDVYKCERCARKFDKEDLFRRWPKGFEV